MTRISSGYSAYSAETIASLFSTKKTVSADIGTSARVYSKNHNIAVNDIERHISDVKSGRGDLSKDVASQLSWQDLNASDLLSRSNPKTLAAYSGYLSALRYDRAARFVNGVESSLSAMSRMQGQLA